MPMPLFDGSKLVMSLLFLIISPDVEFSIPISILSNVVFSHFINTHSLFLSERALNIFISEQPILSTAKDFKEIPEKLLHPTLYYIKNVLNLAVKPQFYNSYSKSFSLKK